MNYECFSGMIDALCNVVVVIYGEWYFAFFDFGGQISMGCVELCVRNCSIWDLGGRMYSTSGSFVVEHLRSSVRS